MIATTPLQLSPTTAIEILIRGLGTAGVYVLIASGLSLIFGLMGVLNFAHGALTTVGTYAGGATLVLIGTSGATGLSAYVPLLVAMLVVFVVLALVGGAIEYSLIRRLYERPPIDQILLTFGVALVVQELMFILIGFYTDPVNNWGGATAFGPPLVQRNFEVVLGPVSVRGLKVFEFLVGALVVAGVWAFLNRTRYGLYIRAGSEDNEMAQALGINVRRVFTVVFAIGIGLAGIAGLFLIWEPTFSNTYLIGEEALLPAFIVVVVGGLGTFKGTVVASVVAGIFAEIGNFLNVFYLEQLASLPEMLLFILLVIVLIVRPTGIYGEEEVGGH